MINVKEYLEEFYPDESFVVFDGLDEAFIGVGRRFSCYYPCYSKKKIIEILLDQDCMSPEEAEEYFEFNIAGLYLDENCPVIVDDDL
jgi:hypothetical protein